MNKKMFALAAVLGTIATVLLGCTMSASDPPATASPATQTVIAATRQSVILTLTAKAVPTSTPLSSETTTLEPTATKTPRPSPTPDSRTQFEDLSEGDWGWESAIRMYERGVISPCSTEPLRLCPDDSFTRLEKLRSMVRVLELTQGFKPSLDAIVGTFLDAEDLLNKEGVFPQGVRVLTEEDILNLEELRRQRYLPRRLQGEAADVYDLKPFLCIPAFYDYADLNLCLSDKVSMAEMFGTGVLLAYGPEVEKDLPFYRADVFKDLYSSHPFARWVLAATLGVNNSDERLYLIEYRADLIDPDAEATRLRWTVLMDIVYLLLGGEL